jgi:hypothetical protein
MAEPIGALRALLSASSAAFENDMKAARDSVRRHGSSMQRALSSVRDSFSEVVGKIFSLKTAMAGLAAASGFAYLVKQAINTADEMGKMAQKVGVSTEELSTLSHVADLSGTSLETLSTGLRQLNKSASDAASGTGEARHALAAMGIDLQDTSGRMRSTSDLFKDIATKFSKMEDGADKTAIAMKVFGRAGAELVPMLNSGAAGIEEMQKRARELGLEISTETAMAAAYFNDQLTDLKATSQGFIRSVMTDMLPGLNRIVERMREVYQESGLVNAVWEGLKTTASEVFGRSLEKQLEDAKKRLAQLYMIQNNYEQGSKLHRATNISHEPQIEEQIRLVAELEQAIKQRDETEAEAMRLSLERQEKKKESQREETELTRKRLKAEQEREANERRAASEAESLRKRQESTIQGLEREVQMTGVASREERVRWEITKGAYADMNDATKERILQLAKELDALDKVKTMAEAGKAVTISVRTEQEVFNDEVKRLGELLDAGAISLETYSRAVAQAREAMKKTTKDGKHEFEDLKRAVEGFGQDASRAIVDFALTGKNSFADMVNAMIADLMRLLVYRKIMEPMVKGFDSFLAGYGKNATWTASTGGFGATGSNIGMYADGGWIREPVVGMGLKSGRGYMIGEGGEDELVVPRSQIGSGGGQSLQASFSFNVNAIDAQGVKQFFERNGRLLSQQMVEELKHDPGLTNYFKA